MVNQINNKSLRERILDALREAILSGEFKPGQPLVESDLAAQFGVSRAPLREAIQTLNNEGLLETVPYHGTKVRILTRTDIEELYSLRSVLEEFAIKRFIALFSEEKLARLEQIYQSMLDAANANDLNSLSRYDREFHDTLIEMSEHTLLQTTWNTVGLRIRQVMALRNMRNTDIKQIAYNHLPIIEALREKHTEQAITFMREHVASAGDLIAEDWNEHDEELDSA